MLVDLDVVAATPELPEAVRAVKFDADGNVSTSDYEFRHSVATGALTGINTREDLVPPGSKSEVSFMDSRHDRIYQR